MVTRVVICPKCGAVVRINEALFDKDTGEPCFTCPLSILEGCYKQKVIVCPKCGTVIEVR